MPCSTASSCTRPSQTQHHDSTSFCMHLDCGFRDVSKCNFACTRRQSQWKNEADYCRRWRARLLDPNRRQHSSHAQTPHASSLSAKSLHSWRSKSTRRGVDGNPSSNTRPRPHQELCKARRQVHSNQPAWRSNSALKHRRLRPATHTNSLRKTHAKHPTLEHIGDGACTPRTSFNSHGSMSASMHTLLANHRMQSTRRHDRSSMITSGPHGHAQLPAC